MSTLTRVNWDRYAATIAALRDEDYSTEEIEDDLGVTLCRCGVLPVGHPGDDCWVAEVVEAEARREVKPEVREVVRDHFRPDLVEAVLHGPKRSLRELPAREVEAREARDKFAEYRDDMHWLERELDDWPQGAKRAPLMGREALHVVSSANLALHLARGFAERAGRDWYVLDPSQRRRYLELAKASIEALARAEELLAAKEMMRQVEASVLREGGRA